MSEKKETYIYRIRPRYYTNFDYAKGAFEYEVQLPGVAKDHVKLRILPELYDLHAQRDEHGVFTLTEYFPYEIDPDSVEAKYENGLLKFHGKVKDPMKGAVDIKLS